MTFTPGSDEGRTDTYEAQKKLQEDDQTAEEQFDEAQQGLRDLNTNFQRMLGIVGALQQSGEAVITSITNSIGKDNSIVTPEQPIIEDVPQYPVVLQRILKVKKDNPEVFSGIVGQMGGNSSSRKKAQPKIPTNEKIKQALLKDEAIILPATYKGGPMEIRKEADFFDVSAALIGSGQESKKDFLGRKIPYDRKKVTEFGGKKGDQRNLVFKHLQKKLGRKNITRAEFDEYAAEQIAAEKDLRKAIKLLNLRSYAANKNIDLSDYPTVESQLDFLNEINKAKRNKTGYLDYRETFDYGHILSAKTGFRLEDLGLNRISNTEIETARNIVSRDPYTNKIIEILQQGNRERGSRRDFVPVVQRMRNTAGSVVEDFIKWRANKPESKDVNLTKILDKFIPRDQHDNYLQFIQKRFYERRKMSGSLKEFIENDLEIPYNDFLKFNNKMKIKVRKLYEKNVAETGNIIGRQQYDQAEKFMREAIDEFIGLHHFSKPKKLRTTKEQGDLYDMAEDLLPRDINTLLDMILPDEE